VLVEGGRVIAVSERAVEIEAHGERRIVCVEGARVATRPLLDDANPLVPVDESEREAFEARGAELLAALEGDARERHRDQVARAIVRGMGRVERRIAAMRGDLARLADAETIAGQAQWLVAEAARAPRGARSLQVTDWSSGEARVLTVPLDPAKPARAQVEAMFQRARRLKRGAKIAEERIAKAEATKLGLARALDDARGARTSDAVDDALVRARALAPKEVTLEAPNPGAPSSRGAAQPKAPPYRTFVSPAGARILVGKGAAQNDRLTFQTARPHDLWLHAKGHTGAHVIVPLAKNASCPADLLVDAAHLAAHFSEARGEGVVEIQYTPRRYLRKPRGSAPGLVVVDREKVLAVRVEPGRVERLLEREG
jgi:predicted ribosome quality control (RQC) complex YloA/Tae2 family protein